VPRLAELFGIPCCPFHRFLDFAVGRARAEDRDDRSVVEVADEVDRIGMAERRGRFGMLSGHPR
jgi:hypothetical protein